MAIAPWRLRLQPATFNGVLFYVDVNAKASGRRVAMHEFAKKDIPYAEDMGRKARKFTITGYAIQGPDNGYDYTIMRNALIAVLELEGPGTLVLPTGLVLPTDGQVQVESYVVTERRELGGYAEIDMSFFEAGVSPSTTPTADTQGNSIAAAQSSITSFQNSSDVTGLSYPSGSLG
jgi:prophage DNA circulation protein